MDILLVRHGESEGNVAASAAIAAGAEVIDIGLRDADVPLTERGQEQAEALGEWLGSSAGQVPTDLWCSPYLRARQTAETALGRAGLQPVTRVDERLRDRELGILDLLTAVGVQARFPQEAERRRWLGKFYYRPPGGESWADVVLRLRSVLADLGRMPQDRTLLIVAHDAVILLFRYACEGLSEEQLLELAATTTILNASVTRLHRDDAGTFTVTAFNEAFHLEAAGAPVTTHAGDADVRPR